MNKSQLIRKAARRGGLSPARAARAVDAMHGVNTPEVFSPAKPQDPSTVPIPAGLAVRLKATRKAVTSLNTEQPLKRDQLEPLSGGTNTMSNESNTQTAVNEGSALGLDVGTSRLVL